MNDLSIVRIKDELRTDSRLLAGFLDHRHRTILENIDKYARELKELAGLPFQTEKGAALDHGGNARATRYAMLTEDQCYFLLTLMRNNPRVVRAKLELVKAFRSARDHIAERDAARVDGKQVRRLETDSISKLVEYASAAGSQNAGMYYMNITKMTNKLLGITAGTRDELSPGQLKQLAAVETVVDIAIRDGIAAGLSYREVYRVAKTRVESMKPALGLL